MPDSSLTPLQARTLRILASVRPRWVLTGGVADPVPVVEAPSEIPFEGVSILVDGRREILVAKLCTLLERSELRDLIDVRALLETGGDLERSLAEAPLKDAGFSPLTLAWVLRELPISVLGKADGLTSDRIDGLARFRDELVLKIAALAAPD